MDYKFVTRADVAAVRKKFKENNPITSAQMALGLCERLLAERDAYREVAVKNWKMWCGEYEKASKQDPMKPNELKKESESSVDAEARRILAEDEADAKLGMKRLASFDPDKALTTEQMLKALEEGDTYK
jgi:hypothetical protein